MSETIHTPAIQLAATILLGLAVIHTFLTSYFLKLAHRYPEGSVAEISTIYLVKLKSYSVFGRES
jgi:hypothetical protein